MITVGRHPLAGRASFGCPRSLCLRVLTTDMPFWRIHCPAGYCNAICREGAAHAAVTDIQADLFQFLGHSRTATLIECKHSTVVLCIAAQAEVELFSDVSQRDQIRSLSVAGRTTAERPQTARTDIHDTAHPSNGKCKSVFLPSRECKHSLPGSG